MKNYILWDLDGTLTDPKEGIIKCLQYALEKFGLTSPPFESLTWCIGPPLFHTFHQLAPGVSDTDVLKLVDLYRERFVHLGMYENRAYPFMVDILMEMKNSRKQFLATSKPHLFANRILIHFEMASYFQRVFGSELSGERSDKGELIKYILDEEKVLPEDVFMIGDRKHDVLGAKKNNVTSIGVTWGYGGRPELQEAGADYIFDAPQDLKAFLLEN